jgi:hypothetical protein
VCEKKRLGKDQQSQLHGVGLMVRLVTSSVCVCARARACKKKNAKVKINNPNSMGLA